MVKDFFVNFAIIISFISIIGQVYRNKEINIKAKKLDRFLFGLEFGILGIFLMLFSVKVTDNLIIDFRNIAIAISALGGGMISSLITGGIIVVFRIAYFGLDAYSMAAFGLAFIMAFICGVISWMRAGDLKKWIYMYIFNLIIFSLTLCIIMGFGPQYMYNVTYFTIGNTIASMFVYYYYQYITSSNRIYRTLKDESSKDFLTGLNNVRSFDKLFNYAQSSAIERNEKLSMLMLDIDFFKKVNDTYGHHEGDVVLKDLGRILLKTVRIFDVVSRNGGEEFSVILLDCDHEHSLEIGERIRRAVEEHEFSLTTGKKIKVTISIGSATYPETIQDIDKLREQADMALYRAKRTGRNKVCSAFEIK